MQDMSIDYLFFIDNLTVDFVHVKLKYLTRHKRVWGWVKVQRANSMATSP
jgi:hypothetical protein